MGCPAPIVAEPILTERVGFRLSSTFTSMALPPRDCRRSTGSVRILVVLVAPAIMIADGRHCRKECYFSQAAQVCRPVFNRWSFSPSRLAGSFERNLTRSGGREGSHSGRIVSRKAGWQGLERFAKPLCEV